MKELTLVAHEWHNKETGHCYVDYIAHPGQDRIDGYTMKPLYYLPSELLKQRDELREALKELVHLHGCEQEGLLSGQPTPEQWYKAVEKAELIITKAEAK